MTTANDDMRRCSPFGCHVAVGDMAPGIHLKNTYEGEGSLFSVVGVP
jgi:hypothetical protein